MGLHGEGGHAVARTFKKGGHVLAGTGDGGLDGLFPDGLLLEGIEEQAAVRVGMILPGSAEKGLPVDDCGGGPSGEAFCTAGSMVGGDKGTRSALAGCDDKTARAQPCSNFGFGWVVLPHVSVIRHRALAVQAEETAVMRLYTG